MHLNCKSTNGEVSTTMNFYTYLQTRACMHSLTLRNTSKNASIVATEQPMSFFFQLGAMAFPNER